MRRRRLTHPHLTASGTAAEVVEAFYDADGTEVPAGSPDATRWARAFYGPDGTWLADETGTVETYAEVADEAPGEAAHWSGPIVFEGIATGDGRLIEPGALTWDENLTLYAIEQEGLGVSGHSGQAVVGRIDRVWRDGQALMAEGRFDLGNPTGREVARQVRDGFAGGISADLDDVSVSVRVAADVIAEFEAAMEGDATLPEPDAEGMVEVATYGSADELMVTTAGRVRAATLVGLPAFKDARVALTPAGSSALAALVPEAVTAAAVGAVSVGDRVATPEGPGTVTAVGDPDAEGGQDVAVAIDVADEDDPVEWTGDVADVEVADAEEPETDDDDEGAVIASLAVPDVPEVPPASWYGDPGLAGPTPLTIDETGRVYGHLATWGSCHTGFEACVTAPKSANGYASFHVGSVVVDDGGVETTLATGRITLGTGHARLDAPPRPAAEHYDNTGTAVADVRAGEDAHGIWVAGALRPGVDRRTLRTLRSSPLSGDWRRIGGNLELVAALAVNTPGFAVPHPEARVASGAPVALVASSGIVGRVPSGGERLTPGDVAALRRVAARARRAEAVALRDRVHGGPDGLVASLAARVHGGTVEA